MADFCDQIVIFPLQSDLPEESGKTTRIILKMIHFAMPKSAQIPTNCTSKCAKLLEYYSVHALLS